MFFQLSTSYQEAEVVPNHRSVGDEQQIPMLTVMGYRSLNDYLPEAEQSAAPGAAGGLALRIPHPTKFATRCLAIGIGPDCSSVIHELASAPWFAHLSGTTVGPRRFDGETGGLYGDRLLRLLQALPLSHIASIALPATPTSAELDLAFELGCALRRDRTFVIMTSVFGNPDLLVRLGQACDCIVGGDGSALHHYYPVRTVSEPASGRLVCYDLYDAFCVWAGRVGEYGTFRPAADAMHVEISTAVPTLCEVDAFANSFRDQLNDQEAMQLFNVVDGLGSAKATPVSFWRNSMIRQGRVPRSP